MSFLRATRNVPTLTPREQLKILTETGRTKGSEREHVIYSMALGTALRESELVALDVGDVWRPDGTVRPLIELTVYKGSARRVEQHDAGRGWRRTRVDQEVRLPRALRVKLAHWWRIKKQRRERLAPKAPLFCVLKDSARAEIGERLSTRTLRYHFRRWQRLCGFERLHSFHILRHTALSNIYRKTKDLRLTQRAARHANVNTTVIYTHKTDDEIARDLEDLEC